MKKNKSLKELMNYAGKHRFLTYSSWVLSVISAILALIPFVYIWLIIKEIIEINPNFSEATNIIHNGWMAVIFAMLSMIIYFGALMCSHLSAFHVASNIRIKTMEHVVSLPLGFMDKMGTGRVRRIVNESSAATETYLAHQLPDMFGAIATPFAMLVLLFVFDWKLGLLSLIPTVLAFIIMTRMTGSGMAEKMKQYQSALEDMNNEAVEYVRGVPVVKTFGQTIYTFKKFKGSIDGYHKWVMAYTKQLMKPMLMYTTIINGVFAILIAAALLMTGHNMVDSTFLLNLIFYIIFTPIISVTLTKIMFMSENNMIVNDALLRINNILDIKPLLEPIIGEHPLNNSIEFNHVSFRYKNSDINAINDVSFKIKSGETVALVGPSGGGKTTAAELISRFWDVTDGEIKIGNVNVKNIKKEDLMKIVSFVFQDSKLIKASILDNVRLSNHNASRDDVLTALHNAQCDDIIAKLPNGIDTIIGTNGVYLSGGEQQRITIARTMLKDSPIVILDEATAFADPENEVLVHKAFEKLSEQKTVVMIAHRLTTVKKANCIFVLKDGKLIESGKHNDLLNIHGLYEKMWNDYQTTIKWRIGSVK